MKILEVFSVSANPPGRPSKNLQAEIYEKILECYHEGVSATTAAKEVGVNVKTANGHYRQISTQHKIKIERTYAERYEVERIQTIASFDNDIMEASKLLREIRVVKKLFKDAKKPIPNYLIRNELDTMKFRIEIKDRKSRYSMSITPDEAAKEKSEEVEE